jgi:hypothetical protein
MDQLREKGWQPAPNDPIAVVLEHVRTALQGLKYGHVSLIVQDGRVVQVDRFEKTRLPGTTSH